MIDGNGRAAAEGAVHGWRRRPGGMRIRGRTGVAGPASSAPPLTLTLSPLAGRGRRQRLALFALVAMLACLRLASPALAHASLITSMPEDGGVLHAAPTRYQLTFNEPVSPLALRLVE